MLLVTAAGYKLKKIPSYSEHSYFTFGILYNVENELDISMERVL